MNWRILAGRAQGMSHVASDTPCEDYFCIDMRDDALCIFVADGAGSATFGGTGAELACETALALSQDNRAFDATWAEDCITHIQTAIQTAVQNTECTDDETSLTARDFACTFLGVIVCGGKTLCFQIGDGAIVIEHDGALTVPIVPQQGEYANMTHFVCDDDALARLVVETLDVVPQQLAVMTDGLQRLALDLNDNTPHPPFFAPFFAALQNADTTDEALHHALDSFLHSDSVNARTDDDKTLVLAVLTP